MCFYAVRATALADAVVCRRRRFDSNRISTIANGAFSGLTALQFMYGAGLKVAFMRCLCIDLKCQSAEGLTRVWRCVDIMSGRMASMIPLQTSK